MEAILNQTGHISIRTGSERLRAMFQRREFIEIYLTIFKLTLGMYAEFGELDINQLSPFTLACVTGQIEAVKEVRRYIYVMIEMLTH
jgi:hypothetical protein